MAEKDKIEQSEGPFYMYHSTTSLLTLPVSVESTGIYPAATIFERAIEILIDKCTKLEQELTEPDQSFGME